MKALAKRVKEEQAEREKTVSERFIDEIDSYLVKNRNTRYEKEFQYSGFYIRPSNYYKCMRQIWYKTLRFPSKELFKAKGIRTLEIGTALHEWVQREVFMQEDFPFKLIPPEEIPVFGTEGIEIFTKEQNRLENRPEMEIGWVDKRWTKKYHLYSIIDGALDVYSVYKLFEFKTINPDDYKYLYEPHDEYKKQSALYSLSLDIDDTIFLYLNKGNSEWKALEHHTTEEQKEWSLNRIQKLDNCLVSLILPEKEIQPLPKYGANATACNWCAYQHLCENDVCEAKFKEVNGFMIYDGER